MFADTANQLWVNQGLHLKRGVRLESGQRFKRTRQLRLLRFVASSRLRKHMDLAICRGMSCTFSCLTWLDMRTWTPSGLHD